MDGAIQGAEGRSPLAKTEGPLFLVSQKTVLSSVPTSSLHQALGKASLCRRSNRRSLTQPQQNPEADGALGGNPTPIAIHLSAEAAHSRLFRFVWPGEPRRAKAYTLTVSPPQLFVPTEGRPQT